MARTITANVPHDRVDEYVARLRVIEGVVSISRSPSASLSPPGDVVTAQATNEATRSILHVVEDLRLHEDGGVATSEARSLVSSSHRRLLEAESPETTWEEMAFHLRQETNVTVNIMGLLFLSGAIAAGGLWSNTLHLVIGAMVVAPGFEPFLRIAFGAIVRDARTALAGLAAAGLGYVLLAFAAGLTTLVLAVLEPHMGLDLEARGWVQYWSQPGRHAIVVSALAAVAGVLTFAAQRTALIAGVMIALALVPAATLVGMGVAVGDLDLAGRALLRWVVDVGLVLTAGVVVLGLKQRFLHKRKLLG